MITHTERWAGAANERSNHATAIVVLHSRAGDERESVALLTELDPNGKHRGLLPLAPFDLTGEGRHWYAIEREASPDPRTFRASLDALSRWLDDTLAGYGIEFGRVAIAGFSQGAVMAYSLGLAPGRAQPGAILAFSGYIPRVDGFDLDLAGRTGLRVAIAHGTMDPNANVDFAREAQTRLSGAGLAVRYHEEPYGHELTAGALAQARAVLAEALR